MDNETKIKAFEACVKDVQAEIEKAMEHQRIAHEDFTEAKTDLDNANKLLERLGFKLRCFKGALSHLKDEVAANAPVNPYNGVPE